MEAIIVALTAVSAALFLRNRNVTIQRNAAQEMNNSSAKCMDGLKSHLYEIEQQLDQQRQKTKGASELIVSLNSQLDEAQQNTRIEAQQNADLVAQVRALRREVERLTMEISDLEVDRESMGQTHNDYIKRISDLEALLDEERKTVKKQYHEISKLESELKLANQDDEAVAQRIVRLEKQLKEAQRNRAQEAPRRNETEADLRREVKRLSRIISNLESEVNQTRLKDSEEYERSAALEMELVTMRSELTSINSQLVDAKSTASQLSQDKAKLESELEEIKQIDRCDAQQLAEMKSKLGESTQDIDAKALRISELELQLQDTTDTKNAAVFELKIENAINMVNRECGLIQRAFEISHAEIRRDGPRATKIIRDAESIAYLLRQFVRDAVIANKEIHGDKGMSKIEAEIVARIDEGIRRTKLNVRVILDRLL